jgi:pimeloyl-ACP methyl ester carboxylesterase
MTQAQSKFITANGLKYHVLEWNNPGDTTYLCLHGFLDASWGFYWVCEALAAQGVHVVAPDWRGHGDSDRIGAGGYYHFMDYLSDLHDIIKQVKREKLFLIGHSMGGSVSGYYAGAFPEQIWRLCIMEGIMALETPNEDIPARIDEWIRSTRVAKEKKPKAYATIEDAAERLFYLDPMCSKEKALFLAEKTTRQTPEGFVFKHDPLHVTRGPYPFRVDAAQEFWKRITAPILMIEGANSPFLELPDLEKRYASFPKHRVEKMENTGHMMIRHAPEEVARLLLDFAR